jgi:hypothetical protein
MIFGIQRLVQFICALPYEPALLLALLRRGCAMSRTVGIFGDEASAYLVAFT